MPIYEFTCEECDENFERLVRIVGDIQATCPNCGSGKTKKKMSTFASHLDGGRASFGSSATGLSDCSTGST